MTTPATPRGDLWETRAQLEHAQKRKNLQEDTSRDESWEYEHKFNRGDVYTLVVFFFIGFVKFMILWLPLFVLLCPPVAIAYAYVSCLPPNTETIPRTCGFWFLFVLFYLMAAPAIVLSQLSLWVDFVTMNTFGWLYVLLTCRWKNFQRSMEAVAPHSDGPWIFMYPADILVAIMGQVHRKGFFKFMVCFSKMFLLVPLTKYWITGNAWVTDLGERLVTQTSGNLADLEAEQATQMLRHVISTSRHEAKTQALIRDMIFSPHYPTPPGDRKCAIGMQQSRTMTFFTQVTHLYRCPTDQPPFVYSNTLQAPSYRVMLWRNNPYHLFTGFVEAHVSLGGPSCPDRLHGLEHPMWLVCGHNRLSADRKVMFSIGYVDKFFDMWMPEYVRTVRTLVFGAEVAAARHQELDQSVDGVSTLKPAKETFRAENPV